MCVDVVVHRLFAADAQPWKPGALPRASQHAGAAHLRVRCALWQEASKTALIYLLWSLPILIVALLVASRRASSANAGLCGLIVAILAALVSAESGFGPRKAALAVAQGIWLAVLVDRLGPRKRLCFGR